MNDYDLIYLSSRERGILQQIKSGSILKLHTIDANNLLRLGFISLYPLSNSNNEYVITSDGIRYAEYLNDIAKEFRKAKEKEQQEESKQEKQYKQNMILAWISIIVSNLIALAALIVSIVK